MPRAAVKPRRTRTTRSALKWREWKLEVRHTPDYLTDGTDHLEITVKAPKGAPIPITETGYRSHFLPPALIEQAGGVAAFITRWLDSEATTKTWSKTEAKWRQLAFELVMPTAPKAESPSASKAKSARSKAGRKAQP